MFVHFYAYVPKCFQEVEHALIGNGAKWLDPLVVSAYEEGERVRMTLGVADGLRVSNDVLVNRGEAIRRQDMSTLPIRVEASGLTSLFPRLDADLKIAAVGAARTQITLSGSYQPHRGQVHALVEVAPLHQVAEASAKNLVDGIAEALCQEETSTSTSFFCPPSENRPFSKKSNIMRPNIAATKPHFPRTSAAAAL